MVRVILVDLAVLFEVRPGAGVDFFPDVLAALDRWQGMGATVVGISTDVSRYGAHRSLLAEQSVPVIDQPLPRWRQVGAWHDVLSEMNQTPEQCVFVAGSPALMAFARQAGVRSVGVLRDPHTMAVLDGLWVDGLADIPWSRLQE